MTRVDTAMLSPTTHARRKRENHVIRSNHFEKGVPDELTPTVCTCGFEGTHDAFQEHRIAVGAKKEYHRPSRDHNGQIPF